MQTAVTHSHQLSPIRLVVGQEWEGVTDWTDEWTKSETSSYDEDKETEPNPGPRPPNMLSSLLPLREENGRNLTKLSTSYFVNFTKIAEKTLINRSPLPRDSSDI